MSRRALETNTLFDFETGALGASGRSFRVRDYDGQGTVTLKGRARVTAGGLKSRVEIETGVDSPSALTRILLGLGLLPKFQYEKYREVWRFRRTVVCFDDTPIGKFVEIEGTRDSIGRTAAALGLSASDFLATSYPMLWLEAGHSGPMVFSPSRKSGRRA